MVILVNLYDIYYCAVASSSWSDMDCVGSLPGWL